MSTEHEHEEAVEMDISGSDGASGSAGSSMNEGEAGSGENPQEILSRRIQELEEENRGLKDQLLRKQADFENFRKRMFREREEATRFGNSQLLLDLIPIIDDFERAIRSSEESKNFDSFHEGIALIEKQFVSMLERKWGLVRFESVGQPFDPQKHEAIAAEERPDNDVSLVLEDYQRGYVLHERVLRPARVKISMPAEPEKDDSRGAPDSRSE